MSNCSTTKNEVTLEFHPNDEAASCMMEMRFYVPTDPNPEVDAVENFRANVMSKAGITTATGDAIANFTGAQCLTPRGNDHDPIPFSSHRCVPQTPRIKYDP